MNILKEFHDLLEERPNEPEVMIMLTRQQANELYEAIHRIIALEKNKQGHSVTPAEKVGHWMRTGEVDVYYDLPSYECSKCEHLSLEDGNYCPYCGAKMQEVEE